MKLYKKYYPLTTATDVYKITSEDCTKLISLMQSFRKLVKSFNLDAAYKAKKAGLKRYTKTEITYDRDISLLAGKLREGKADQIDEKDIQFINTVLYAYKMTALYLYFGSTLPYDGNGGLDFKEALIEDRNP